MIQNERPRITEGRGLTQISDPSPPFPSPLLSFAYGQSKTVSRPSSRTERRRDVLLIVSRIVALVVAVLRQLLHTFAVVLAILAVPKTP